MPSKLASKKVLTGRLHSSEKDHDNDVEQVYYDKKKKVECICPKCGQKHKMAFHWIGRGTPRKYCPLCKAGN
jgi:hypothetical protein